MKVKCGICPRGCELAEGQYGFCRGRRNEGGTVVCANYGRLTALALDPIEKKPLAMFYPGSKILSCGSYGCNLACPYCQNCEISMADAGNARTAYFPPEALVDKALELVPAGNIGIAYTYNEPLISFEYVLACSKLAHEHGLKNVLVTNGYVCEGPLSELLPFTDAMNIDLKGFSARFYGMVGGRLEDVERTITLSAAKCHVEITTLVIPGENDSADEMAALSEWLAGVSPDIPLHLTRFFPRYRFSDREPTPVSELRGLADIARQKLRHVFIGNC